MLEHSLKKAEKGKKKYKALYNESLEISQDKLKKKDYELEELKAKN